MSADHFWRRNVRPGTTFGPWSRRERSAWLLIVALLVFALLPVLVFAAVDPVTTYRAQMTREAQFRFGIPAPVPAIAAQMKQESGGNPLAKSRVGAAGLMQFMPATADWAAQAGGLGQPDPFNPLWAIRAGVWYDRWLYDRIKVSASDCDRWLFVLAGYNGGLGYVYKRQKASTAPGFWDRTGTINPGIHPSNQHENETYGPKILYRHQRAYAHWGRVVCL